MVVEVGPRDGRRPGTWASWWGTGLSLAGLGISGYLTFEHYTNSSSLSCPAGGGVVDCLKVTTSAYSAIAGVPVAVLGLVFFAVMGALQLPAAWRRSEPAVRLARVGWALVGVSTAIWLIYAELFGIDAICIWCTAVHTVTVAVFAVTVFGTAALPVAGAGATGRPPGPS